MAEVVAREARRPAPSPRPVRSAWPLTLPKPTLLVQHLRPVDDPLRVLVVEDGSAEEIPDGILYVHPGEGAVDQVEAARREGRARRLHCSEEAGRRENAVAGAGGKARRVGEEGGFPSSVRNADVDASPRLALEKNGGAVHFRSATSSSAPAPFASNKRFRCRRTQSLGAGGAPKQPCPRALLHVRIAPD